MSGTPRVVAAVSLDDAGGGVAAVSRLLWRSVQMRWGADSRLWSLLERGDAVPTMRQKLRFGAQAMTAQATRQARWILFGHLGVARTQAMIPGILQRPYGIFLHGVEAWRPLSSADRRVLKGAALLVSNSEYTARRVMAQHPDVGPVVACPLALDPETSAVSGHEPPAIDTGRAPIVLMVGRLSADEAYKGHTEVIEAWPEIARACPDAQLVIAGEGDDAARLKALARSTGVAGSVRFEGFVSRAALGALYDDAAVFVMPSRGEGFGVVYLEAMAHGLPCVASTDDAAGEVVQDGTTGFLVPQADRHAIASRIVALVCDADLRRRMGGAGRQRLQELFSFDRFSTRLIGLLESSLEERAA